MNLFHLLTNNLMIKIISKILNSISKAVVFLLLINTPMIKIKSQILDQRVSYSMPHLLLRLLEEWREKLGSNYTVRKVLMFLSFLIASLMTNK